MTHKDGEDAPNAIWEVTVKLREKKAGLYSGSKIPNI